MGGLLIGIVMPFSRQCLDLLKNQKQRKKDRELIINLKLFLFDFQCDINGRNAKFTLILSF